MEIYIAKQKKRGCKFISVWPKTCGYVVTSAIQELATWRRQFVKDESSKTFTIKSSKDRVTTETGSFVPQCIPQNHIYCPVTDQ